MRRDAFLRRSAQRRYLEQIVHSFLSAGGACVLCMASLVTADWRGPTGMAIVLTESAADRVRSHLVKRGAGVGLRVGIKKTGCSGFAYVVNYADEIRPGDAVFEARGVKVVVDSASLPLIDGTVVDFVKQGLNEAFKFQNPKAKGECGCGESFSV